ncbi:hypothetical protein [Oscillibacter sp.]|uniref:hypothetical protein n=1 Tax=Oscillibacter sp. TaxID=1945593 RepID=UPI002D7E16A5|nr:hypothetical protein [Oscillibacter sp.]
MRDVDELRPPTAGRLLALWRESREAEDPFERVLTCNGRILAECCFFQGERVYADETEALADLTGRQMETLLLRLAGSGGPEENRRSPAEAVNPEFDAARFAALWRM